MIYEVLAIKNAKGTQEILRDTIVVSADKEEDAVLKVMYDQFPEDDVTGYTFYVRPWLRNEGDGK